MTGKTGTIMSLATAGAKAVVGIYKDNLIIFIRI